MGFGLEAIIDGSCGDHTTLGQRSALDQMDRLGRPYGPRHPCGMLPLATAIWNKVLADASDTTERRLINADYNE
jgi:hypothetical protein